MQVIKVTVGLFLLTISAYFSLKFYGLGQSYQNYSHPLFDRPKPWIFALGGDSSVAPSHTWTAFKKTLEDQKAFLGVYLLLNGQNHFFGVPVSWQKKTFSQDGRSFSQLSDQEVEDLDLGNGEAPIRLESILEKLVPKGETPILLWLGDNKENIDLRLEAILKKQKSLKHFFVHSEFDVVDKSIRKLLPEILYGTGVGQRTRLLMFGSIGLESISAVDGDFLITPLKQQRISVISKEMKEELQRRKKPMLIGPLETEAEIDEALQWGADGYITTIIQSFQKRIDAVAPSY